MSVEFSRQEYWSGLPFPTPGDRPVPESASPVSPALQADSLPTELSGKPPPRQNLWPNHQDQEGAALRQVPYSAARPFSSPHWRPSHSAPRPSRPVERSSSALTL